MSPPPPQSRRHGNSWEASNALRARAPSNCRLQSNHGCQVNPATIKLKINTPTSIAGNQSSSQKWAITPLCAPACPGWWNLLQPAAPSPCSQRPPPPGRAAADWAFVPREARGGARTGRGPWRCPACQSRPPLHVLAADPFLLRWPLTAADCYQLLQIGIIKNNSDQLEVDLD